MIKYFSIAALMAVSSTSVAYASDLTEGWSGEAGIAASSTSGNTETTDINGTLNLAKEAGVWRNKFNASIDYGKNAGTKNKSRWAMGYQLDRDLNDRTYIYGNASYFQDEFGAYKNSTFLGAGVGYKLVLPDPLQWDIEGGIGYKQDKLRLAPGTAGGAASLKQDGVALRAASNIDYKLNEMVSLYNDSEILWSEADTYLWNDAGITAQLMGNLAARASFRLDHHTDVAPGFEKTDTALRFGVVYTMK